MNVNHLKLRLRYLSKSIDFQTPDGRSWQIAGHRQLMGFYERYFGVKGKTLTRRSVSAGEMQEAFIAAEKFTFYTNLFEDGSEVGFFELVAAVMGGEFGVHYSCNYRAVMATEGETSSCRKADIWFRFGEPHLCSRLVDLQDEIMADFEREGWVVSGELAANESDFEAEFPKADLLLVSISKPGQLLTWSEAEKREMESRVSIIAAMVFMG